MSTVNTKALETNVHGKIAYVHLDYAGGLSRKGMTAKEKLDGIKSGKYHISCMSMKLPHLNPVKLLVKKGIRFYSDVQSKPQEDGSREINKNRLHLLREEFGWGQTFDEIIAIDYVVLE